MRQSQPPEEGSRKFLTSLDRALPLHWLRLLQRGCSPPALAPAQGDRISRFLRQDNGDHRAPVERSGSGQQPPPDRQSATKKKWHLVSLLANFAFKWRVPIGCPQIEHIRYPEPAVLWRIREKSQCQVITLRTRPGIVTQIVPFGVTQQLVNLIQAAIRYTTSNRLAVSTYICFYQSVLQQRAIVMYGKRNSESSAMLPRRSQSMFVHRRNSVHPLWWELITCA